MDNRDAAKAAIVNESRTDPELAKAFAEAKSLEVTLAAHEHAQAMRDKDLGVFGRWLGGESSAPMTIAFVAMMLAIGGFAVLHWLSFGSGDAQRAAALVNAADKCLGLAGLALGFVFGKAGNSK